MQFEFASPSKIIFGIGKLNTIPEIIDKPGKRVLVISGGPSEITGRLSDLLDRANASSNFIKSKGEPTVEVINDIVNYARQFSTELVIGIGGGSALDTAKTTAVMLTNPGAITDYLEVVGSNQPITNPALPLIAIPTTSGTGAEVTRNAVIGSPEHRVKVSLRSPYLLPKIALIDPELTLSVPQEITACTGMDALTQLIEPYCSNSANPLTDAICVEGLKHIAQSFYRAYDNGNDLKARKDMSLASLFSGLALANAKLGAVHGLAGVIGGEISAHHGAICASLLAEVMDANINVLQKRAPDHPVLERYQTIGMILSRNPEATQQTAVQWVRDLARHMNIQPLSSFGLVKEQFSAIIEMAYKSSSMKGNPITLLEDELRNILGNSL